MNVYVINRKNNLPLLITCYLLLVTYYLLFGTTWFNLFEEVISFVIYQNKCREIFHFNFPDCFHAQFRIFYALNALDVVLSKDCSRSADRTQIEAAIFLTSICNLLATVTFRQHNHAATVALEQLNIRVHTSGSCRSH